MLSAPEQTETLRFLNNEIDRLSEQLDDIDKQLRIHARRFAGLTNPQFFTVREIQQELDSDSLLLEYSLGEQRSYVWVVTNNTIRGFELAPRQQIEMLATVLLRAITARNRGEPNETPSQREARWALADKDYSEAANSLSKLILEPVASMLGEKRLVVVADGALQLIPFGLLPEPAGSLSVASVQSSALIVKHEIVSLPSASVLALQRQLLANRKPAPLKIAVLADPVFGLEDQRVVDVLASARKVPKRTARPARENTPRIQNPTSATILKGQTGGTTALRSVGADPERVMYRLLMSRIEATEISRCCPIKSIIQGPRL